jgi:hypothetical protein
MHDELPSGTWWIRPTKSKSSAIPGGSSHGEGDLDIPAGASLTGTIEERPTQRQQIPDGAAGCCENP